MGLEPCIWLYTCLYHAKRNPCCCGDYYDNKCITAVLINQLSVLINQLSILINQLSGFHCVLLDLFDLLYVYFPSEGCCFVYPQ